jgi:hypothetical protein
MDDPEFKQLQQRVADLQAIEAEKWRDCAAAQATLWRIGSDEPMTDEGTPADWDGAQTLEAWLSGRRDLESAVREMITYAKRKATGMPGLWE